MKHSHMMLCSLILCFPVGVLAQEATPKKFVVPFEMTKTQHMVVKVLINGKGPYRVVFDTGAPDSLLSNRVAREAGLFPKDFKKPLFSLFGAMGQMKIKEMQLGELKAEDLSTMVLDHPTVQAISGIAGPLEGIIGFTFYARYNMSIDYEKKQMTFEPNDYKPTNAMELIMKRMMAPKSVREMPRVLAPAGLVGIRVTKDEGDEEAGVSVKDVLEGSPAAAAGLKAGDRLLTLDGRWTDTVSDCYIASTFLRVGTAIHAEVLRDGKKMQLSLKVRAGL